MLKNGTSTYIIVLLITLISVTNVIGQNKKKKKATSKEVASFVFKSEGDRKKFESEFFKAQQFKIDEEWQDEIEALLACQEVSSGISVVHFELGKAYLKSDNLDSAIPSFKKALEIEPNNNWYTLFLADAYRANFKYNEEYKLREKLTNQYPENLPYRQLLIESLLLSSKHKEAIEQFDILESNYGIQPEYSFQKHQLYTTLKDWKSAENEIIALIKEFPTEYSYQLGLAEYYAIQKDTKKAISTYENVLKQSPKNGGAEFGLFQIYFQNNQLQKAEKYLGSAIKSDDLSRQEQLRIVDFAYTQFTQQKRSKESIIEIIEIGLKKYPDQFEFYGYLGDIHPVEEYEKKVENYKKALSLKPLYEMYRIICEVYFLNQQFDSTIVWTNKTIENYEYNTQPYLLNAYSHLNLNNHKEAYQAATNGLEFVLEKEIDKLPFLSVIGSSAHNLKKYKESDKAYQKILKIDPTNISAKNNYSYYLSVRGEQLDLAARLIEEVLKEEPNNPTFLDTYGWVLFKQNKLEKANEILSKAIELDSAPSSDMFEHLGDCYKAQNNVPKALENWKKAKASLGAETNEKLDQKIKENE